MQNGQIPFPLHLLLPNPPLIWKSSAKSGKKSGKLGKQEIWFHAKMPNRPQPPSQQRCQGIFQRFRHIRVFSSAKNDALFARTLPSTSVLCSPPANCLQVVCSSIMSHVNLTALSSFVTSRYVPQWFLWFSDKPMSTSLSHLSTRPSCQHSALWSRTSPVNCKRCTSPTAQQHCASIMLVTKMISFSSLSHSMNRKGGNAGVSLGERSREWLFSLFDMKRSQFSLFTALCWAK